jgi:hypothetical protein
MAQVLAAVQVAVAVKAVAATAAVTEPVPGWIHQGPAQVKQALPCRAFSIAQSSTLSHVEGQQLDATFARCDGVMMDPNLCKVQRYHVMVDLAL